MKMTLFESSGPIVASRNVPFICLWVRNPACTLQAWMGDNRESKLRPKKHCKTSPFLPFCKSYTKYRKMCSFCHIGNIWQYFAMLGNIFNLPHINCVISKNFVYILHEVFFALSILQVYIPGVLLIICYLSAYLLTFLPNVLQKGQTKSKCLLHFVAFFHVALLFSTGVDNKKVGVDNEKALELTNSTVLSFP